MYSLLLVDDEPSILTGLYQNVDWDEIEVDQVYKAGLASDALEIIRKHHIDIVVTDIRMPEMDGIQLAEAVRKNWPYTKIIFLTGYQDFDYAQTAVSIGVFRYVLKPVLYEDIKRTVRDAIEALAGTLTGNTRLRDMEEKMASLRPVLRESAVFRWLEQGDTQILEDTDSLREYDIPVRITDCGFILAVKTDNSMLNIQETAIIHISVWNTAMEILCPGCRTLNYMNIKNHSVIIFFAEDKTETAALQARVVERLGLFQLTLAELLNHKSITLFWTNIAPVKQIHTEYMDLESRIDRHITVLSNSIIGPETPGGKDISAGLKSLTKQPSLAQLIICLRKNETQSRLDEIFAELSQLAEQDVLLLQVYHEITGAIITDSIHRNLPLRQWAGEFITFFESMTSVRTLEQFCRISKSAADKYIDYVNGNILSQTRHLITQIQSIVRESLAKDVTVASLAEQFSYHPNYLSRLFKQETKISLQEFIINERIAAARKLLMEGMKVGDVSLMVGYESAAHFSRIFKKLTGQTPKQFH